MRALLVAAGFLVASSLVSSALAVPGAGPQTSATHVPFPEVRNLKDVRITLSRGWCLGACPVYKVEIDGDGTVIYSGEDHVAVRGEQRAHVSQEAVARLVEMFRKADYFSLQDSYRADVRDLPSFTTSITIGTRTKSVVDYVGVKVGMPQDVMDIEDAIDGVAGTKRWITGR